jgi:hypothetical protein
MIQDPEMAKAVSRMRQRAERQTDLQKLVRSYVDSGIITQINNQNHQILFGRRGTGKTHVLQVLRAEISKDGGASTYIDCRTLGSTSQFSDPSVALPARCLALFRDILLPVYNTLLEEIVAAEKPTAGKALEQADILLNALTSSEKKYQAQTLELGQTRDASSGSNVGIDASAAPKISLGARADEKRGESVKETLSVTDIDKVAFPDLTQALRAVIENADLDLYILLDEWSSLPQDIQPYLAEFLKRGILPVQRVTVKIAALEQRSVFSETAKDGLRGFEVGADVSISQDLDDSYVFDRNPEHITDLYAEIIFRHLHTELPEGYLSDLDIYGGKDLASKLFTERRTFMELARAAEGVIRDLMCIFASSYFHAHKRGRATIDKSSVVEAARQWFEQDKTNSLDEAMQTVLRRLIDEVIGQRRARSFLVSRELSQHEMIQKLVDARVLHLMQRGYADKDNPGVRYNIYSLDYGTYVDLIGTSKQPEIELNDQDGGEIVVPFDDKRSIRRIILRREILEK